MTGLFVGLAPTFITPAQALELCSIGTLFAFVIVSLGVIVAARPRARPARARSAARAIRSRRCSPSAPACG